MHFVNKPKLFGTMKKVSKIMTKFLKVFEKVEKVEINIGDKVVNTLTGEQGVVINQYDPTPASICNMSTIICESGKYHVQTSLLSLVAKKEVCISG